jgi:nucleotide-binding universal stress UspA family protein
MTMTALSELHLHRLLVAVDGSNTAELALSAAVTAARRDHAAITLLAVTPDFVAESHSWIAGSPDPAVLQEEADEEARRLLCDTVDRIPDDIPVTRCLRHGKAGAEIVAQSREPTTTRSWSAPAASAAWERWSGASAAT